MTKRPDDDLIKERFDQLRQDVERGGGVPDFRAMMDRARQEAADAPSLQVIGPDAPAAPSGPGHDALRPARHANHRGATRRRALLLGGWASVAMAAAVAALLLTGGEDSGDEEFDALVAAFATDATTGAWRSPTSRLLDVPGVELLGSVPSIGGSLRGLDPARQPAVQGSGGGQDRL